MSGAMRKIGEYLGLLEDTGRYDDEYDDDLRRRRPLPVGQPGAPPSDRARPRPAPVADLSERRRPALAPRPAGHGGRAVPDHHAAPAHLQRGAHRRRELPRRHAR